MERVGRNDPCPCGSGKKWKKCCLALEDVAAMPAELQYALDWHSRDRAYTGEVMQWLQDKHPAWMREAYDRIVEDTPPKDGSASFEYIASYLLWHYTPTPDGPTVAEHYFTALPKRLGERRAWYEAHRRSWLGLWEVRQVEPSRSLQLRDLLTGEERTVTEREGSRCLNVLDNILARVVDDSPEASCRRVVSACRATAVSGDADVAQTAGMVPSKFVLCVPLRDNRDTEDVSTVTAWRRRPHSMT